MSPRENDVFLEDLELLGEAAHKAEPWKSDHALNVSLPDRNEDLSSHTTCSACWEAVIYTFARQYFKMFSLHNFVQKPFSS